MMTPVALLPSTLIFLFVMSVPIAPSVIAAEESSTRQPGGEVLLAANKRKPSPARRNPKHNTTPPESGDIGRDTGYAARTSPSSGLSNQTTGRGLLGFFMGKNSAMIFGAGVTVPRTKTMALDGGLDYVKVGNEYLSVSMLRFAGGGAYIIPTGRDSAARFGGRLGIARVTVSYTIPPIFEGDEPISESKSSSSLYGELRGAYEMKLGSLIAGGEIQIPIFYADKTSGTEGIAIYGSLGVAF
jgi:hypothetical protein